MDWENPKNFEKFNLKKVTVYSKEIKKNGKIKRDSLLLKQYDYNKEKSTIKGINHNWFYVNHGGGSHREYYNFENEYSKDNLITRKSLFLLSEEKKEKGKIENNSTIEEFEYDAFTKVIKSIVYNKKESVYLFKKDTTHLFISINNPKITEFEYDSKNRKIKQFLTADSTTYYSKFDMKSEFKVSKSCAYCPEKHLKFEWIYNENNLIEEILYASENNMHSKKTYFYDDINRLIKTIDSTNYFSGSPVLYSSITYKYFTNGNKEKTTINYLNSLENKTIEVYDNFGRIISRSKTIPDFNSNELQFFEYENDKITKTMTTDNSADVSKTILTFNKNGLLVEEKWILNNLLTGIEKYYYE